MLDDGDLIRVSAEFGVDEAQVRRDHVISHILHALAELDVRVTFFGGTALSRTHLIDPDEGARLSEDIDLLAMDRKAVAAALDRDLPRALRREFPRGRWNPALSEVRHLQPASFVVDGADAVRIQLINGRDHHELASYPTERHAVLLRYSDLPEQADLTVPTLVAFAAMKTAAWIDRLAPRDLYDLSLIARLGGITPEAADLVRRVTGWRVRSATFERTPAEHSWQAQLRHQMKDVPSAQECLDAVRRAYSGALGEAL